MTRALPAAAFAAALVVATPLAAQVECDEDGPQQAMNVCALDAYRAADAELNAVYAIEGSTRAMLRRLDQLLGRHLDDVDARLGQLMTLRDEIAKYRDHVGARIAAGSR